MKGDISVDGVAMMDVMHLPEGFMPDVGAIGVTRVFENGGPVVDKAAGEALCLSREGYTGEKGRMPKPRCTTRTAVALFRGNQAPPEFAGAL